MLREVKQITGFQYVRFHAILHDEVGVYDEDKDGKPIYNFSYVDQIYDGLLAAGVKPFVEISFMPKKLASRAETLQAFWYKPNVTPPKDYAKWDDMITQFCTHLVERYGIDEVASWYFEVWNEPNIDFWAGNPKQETYFELYDHTATRREGRQPSSPRWRPFHGASGMGRCHDRARGHEQTFRSISSRPTSMAMTPPKTSSRPNEKHSARPDGLPRGQDGARSDQGVGAS